METSLAEIRKIEASLGKLMNKEINISIAYKLSKLLKVLTSEMKLFEENRIKLVKKYGKKAEGTDDIKVQPESMEEFMKEFNELMQEKVNIDFEPVPISVFGNISLSPIDILNLDGYIIKNEEPVIIEKPVVEESNLTVE